MSLRDQIKAADDRKRKFVPTPEWGIEGVWVGTLSMRRKDALDQLINAARQEDGTLASIRDLYTCAVCEDEQGQPVFTADDLDWLHTKSGVVGDRIFQAAVELNPLTQEAVEQVAKN